MKDKTMHKLIDEHTWEVKEMEICTGCGEIRNPPGVPTVNNKLEIMEQRAKAFQDKCSDLEARVAMLEEVRIALEKEREKLLSKLEKAKIGGKWKIWK